jgi:ribosomal-protein-alanine N-acetyltransferase
MIEIASQIRIRKMKLDDLPVVREIDRLSFPIPWPERTYRFELLDNPSSHLLVAEKIIGGRCLVVGYVGYWLIVDELHISTIAIHPECRQQGLGTCLIQKVLAQGARLGVLIATLEVRVSNDSAIHLYRKFGFNIVGTRPRYYRDNDEDAYLMSLEDLSTWRTEPEGGGV